MNENNQEFQLWNIEKKALLLMLDSLMEMKNQYEEGIKESVDLQKEVDSLETVRRSSQRYIEKLEAENRDLRKRIQSLHHQLYESSSAIESESNDNNAVQLVEASPIETPHGTFRQFELVDIELGSAGIREEDSLKLEGLLVSYEPSDDLLEFDYLGYLCSAGATPTALEAFDKKISEEGFKEETADGVAYFIPSSWIVAIKKASRRGVSQDE